MGIAVLLPFYFLKFWFFDSPVEIIAIFNSFNQYFMNLFALPLSIKTFFKPLKNEYREGLVGFSRAMGILIKSTIILVDLIILFFLLVIELLIILSVLLFPILTFFILFF